MPSRRKPKSFGTSLVRGDWTFEVYGPRGGLKARRDVRNLVVNDGLDWLREFCFQSLAPTSYPDIMQYIGIGTGSTPVSATDSTLQTESVREAVDTYTEGGTGVVTISNTFAAGVGTGTITEAGLFNDASAGTMFARIVFTGVAKDAGDTLKVSATFTFTSV